MVSSALVGAIVFIFVVLGFLFWLLYHETHPRQRSFSRLSSRLRKQEAGLQVQRRRAQRLLRDDSAEDELDVDEDAEDELTPEPVVEPRVTPQRDEPVVEPEREPIIVPERHDTPRDEPDRSAEETELSESIRLMDATGVMLRQLKELMKMFQKYEQEQESIHGRESELDAADRFFEHSASMRKLQEFLSSQEYKLKGIKGQITQRMEQLTINIVKLEQEVLALEAEDLPRRVKNMLVSISQTIELSKEELDEIKAYFRAEL